MQRGKILGSKLEGLTKPYTSDMNTVTEKDLLVPRSSSSCVVSVDSSEMKVIRLDDHTMLNLGVFFPFFSFSPFLFPILLPFL